MARSSFLNPLILWLAFAVPCVGAFWFVDRGEHEASQDARVERQALLERLCVQFSRRSDPLSVCQEAGERLARCLTWNGDPLPIIEALPPGAVRFYLFSASGKRLSRPGFAADMVIASERCHAFLRQAIRGKAGAQDVRERRLVESFLGTEGAVPILAEYPGKVQSLEKFGVTRFVGLFPFRAKGDPTARGSFIMIVDPRRISCADLVQQARERMRRLAGPAFHFVDIPLEEGKSHSNSALGAEVAAARPLEGLTGFFQSGDSDWSGIVHDRRYLLLVQTLSLPPLPSLLQRYRGEALLAFGVGLGLLLVAFGLERRGIPLRLHIALVFGAVVGVGLSFVLGFGATYLGVRRDTLYRERFDQSREILSNIDAGLPFFSAKLETRFRWIASRLASMNGDQERVKQFLDAIPGAGSVLAIDLFHTSGKCLYQGPSVLDGVFRHFWQDEYRSAMERVSAYTARSRARENTRPTGEATDTASMAETGESSRSEKDILIQRMGNNLRRNSGRLLNDALVGSPLTLCFQLLTEREGSPAGALWIRLRDQAVERAYVRFLARGMGRRASNLPFACRLFAVDRFGKPTSALGKRFPGHLLQDLKDAMGKTGRPVSRVLSMAGRSYLLVGSPCRHWKEGFLFLVSPLAVLERESAGLISRFLLFAGLVGVFALGLGMAAARILLSPLAPIGDALRRIASAQYREGFSLETGDEFETIAQGIEKTCHELRERAIAGTIHEHLLPPGSLTIDGVRLHGWIRSRAEIGGEIFDFQQTRDRSAAFWMIGAPGNSIVSALILAMGKIACRLFFEPGGSGPRAVYEALQRQFGTNVTGFQDARLFLGSIDPATRSFQGVCTANHLVLFQRPGHPWCVLGTGQEIQDIPGLREFNTIIETGERILVLSPGCLLREHSQGDGVLLARLLTNLEHGVEGSELGKHVFDLLRTTLPACAENPGTIILCEVASI